MGKKAYVRDVQIKILKELYAENKRNLFCEEGDEYYFLTLSMAEVYKIPKQEMMLDKEKLNKSRKSGYLEAMCRLNENDIQIIPTRQVGKEQVFMSLRDEKFEINCNEKYYNFVKKYKYVEFYAESPKHPIKVVLEGVVIGVIMPIFHRKQEEE